MENKMRTLGFWQPYGSLMLRGKIETRVVEVGRKPPFPLGEYLFYTTHKSTDENLLSEWCGEEILDNIMDIMVKEPTSPLNGYAIAVAELVSIRPMTKEDESKCFIKYFGTTEKVDKKARVRYYHQNCLIFENIRRIVPFKFEFGKQGVGIATNSTINRIEIALDVDLEMREGVRSAEVFELQRLVGVKEDGVFGVATKEAVLSKAGKAIISLNDLCLMGEEVGTKIPLSKTWGFNKNQ